MKRLGYNLLLLFLTTAVIIGCKKKNEIRPSSLGLTETIKDSIIKAIEPSKIIIPDSISNSGFIAGINGHPLDAAPSPYASISTDDQIALVKRLGMSYYRIGVGISPGGSPTNPWTLRKILASAEKNNVTVLPMLQLRDLSYEISDEENYKLGKAIGIGFATQYGKYFTYYELGNEQENPLLVSGSVGDKAADYDLKKVKSIASFMNELNLIYD